MNKSMIRYLLSKLLLIEAVLLLVPVSVATYYQESRQVFTALFTTIGILILLGSLGILRKPKNQRIYTKEGVLIVLPSVGFYGLSLEHFPLSFQDKSQASSMPSLKSVLVLQLQERPF